VLNQALEVVRNIINNRGTEELTSNLILVVEYENIRQGVSEMKRQI
jgi:hypothetical protein